MDEQREWFLEIETTLGEDAVKIVEISIKDLEHYKCLVDKAVAGLQRLTPILKEILQWVKCYQTALHAKEKSFMKESVKHCGNFHHCLILRNCQAW